jgi:hypothetical protein
VAPLRERWLLWLSLGVSAGLGIALFILDHSDIPSSQLNNALLQEKAKTAQLEAQLQEAHKRETATNQPQSPTVMSQQGLQQTDLPKTATYGREEIAISSDLWQTIRKDMN